MCWTVMDYPSHHRFPPNGTLEAPLPPVRGFFLLDGSEKLETALRRAGD
jgi:hypothetical protein